jgi:transcriptional regulator with XRE-family HTH domain
MSQTLKNIRSIRESKGFSQLYMGLELGMSESSYRRFEKGGKKDDFNVIQQVAKVFEVKVQYLVDYHEITYPDQYAAPSISLEGAETYDPIKGMEQRIRNLENTIGLHAAELTRLLKEKEK